MGIGNSTSAAALLSAFSGWDPSETAGAGTGVEVERLWHKIEVLRQALNRITSAGHGCDAIIAISIAAFQFSPRPFQPAR